ncbi:MAG: hypothetical protein JXR84_28480, partial [Anaerolineae bacterium]|nr:hypothetical protein [Anaerolineae bacterium]
MRSRMRCHHQNAECFKPAATRTCAAQAAGHTGCDCTTGACRDHCRYATARAPEATDVYYAGSNQPRTAVTDPGGVTTYSGYDAAGRLSYTQDTLGHATVIPYDALGRQIFITDAQSQVTRREYDAAGRLSAVTT